MARQPNLHRQLALAEALADGIPEREIVKKFSMEWSLTREAIRKAIKTLLATWVDQKPHRFVSISPWEKAPETIERMQQLRTALATREARGQVVKRFAALWEVSPGYVDKLITRTLSEDQHNLIDESQAELQRYIAKIQSQVARYQNARDFPSLVKAFARLNQLTQS